MEKVEFPEEARVSWIQGEVWIDKCKQQIFSHAQVKMRIATVLDLLANTNELGYFFPDGVYVSNREADLSNVPDGVFVSNDALEAGRAQFVEGKDGGYT